MRKKQRKSYTTEFKVKIALEAIKGQRTINEIATHYGVHPNMVTQWKKQALESLPDVFSAKRERIAEQEEALKAKLYQEIGQLKVELDWLKKKFRCSRLAGRNNLNRPQPRNTHTSLTICSAATFVRTHWPGLEKGPRRCWCNNSVGVGSLVNG
jgi:transposase